MIFICILAILYITFWCLRDLARFFPRFWRKKVIPIYCSIHGCKYKDITEYGTTFFDPETGEAYRFNRILATCPNYNTGYYPFKNLCYRHVVQQNVRENLPDVKNICIDPNNDGYIHDNE